MKRMNIVVCSLATLITLVATPAFASTLMLDFGTVAATDGGNLDLVGPPVNGDNRLNSPLHTDVPSFTDTTWNTLGTGDAAGLLFSDGTASGASVNTGANSGSTEIDLSVVPSSASLLGGSANSGIYDGDSAERDGIFHSTGSGNRPIGVQVTGLAAGSYDIYITGRNTSTGGSSTMTSYAGVGTTGTNFDYIALGYASSSVNYPTGNDSAWIESGMGVGENYMKLTITLEAGDALDIALSQTNGSDSRGFINSLQITPAAVPEPSSILLLGMGLFALVANGRRSASRNG